MNIGREGMLDDTKPTIHEAERNKLKNNEQEMHKDSKAFYEKLTESLKNKPPGKNTKLRM
jgi:hypothetical protein